MTVNECKLPAGIRLLEFSIGERWLTLQADFLQVPAKQFEPFDRILMNPPYSESRWKQHVTHVRQVVKPGGRIIAVLPDSTADEKLHNILEEDCDINDLGIYEHAFEYTVTIHNALFHRHLRLNFVT
ncbi:class I SAM-dependent methyltransferase [Photorhabdus bodei]|uniref:Class I SAM-dependent methyltransferase n=1 Tax=Photorhabdus bodei TaxID=2029681 RepID=A0AAW6BQF3_9GAMM|nr:class I SAM-dependent methyltransferase [Photorhabdus bodei]MDB6374958.1 class I SAM-dependent methyltransferase [Photorhabdus bodei]